MEERECFTLLALKMLCHTSSKYFVPERVGTGVHPNGALSPLPYLRLLCRRAVFVVITRGSCWGGEASMLAECIVSPFGLEGKKKLK